MVTKNKVSLVAEESSACELSLPSADFCVVVEREGSVENKMTCLFAGVDGDCDDTPATPHMWAKRICRASC